MLPARLPIRCTAAVLALLLAGCLAPPADIPPTSTLPPSPPTLPAEGPTGEAAPDTGETNIPAITGTTGPTADPRATLRAPGPCEHLLWPLRDGATWTYRLLSPDGGETSIDLVARVGETGATLSSEGRTAALICGDGVLAGLPPLPAAHPDLGRRLAGANPTGALLPAPSVLLPLGQPTGWDLEVDAGGELAIPGEAGATVLPVTGGQMVLIHETGELQHVAVPAGEFLALPVMRDVLLDARLQGADGSEQSAIVSASSRLHFAEGVGLVRVEYLGGIVSTAGGATPLEPGMVLELVAYNLPE